MDKLKTANIFKNISYNLVANILTAMIAFISLPFYFKLMSNDNFGIFTFLFVLLIFFKVFDLGISPTIMRYVSKNYNLYLWQSNSKSLIIVCEIFYIFLSLLILFFFLKFQNFIIYEWLKLELFEGYNQKNISKELNYIFVIFAIILSSKLFTSMYRGVLYAIGEQPFFNISRCLFEFFNLIIGIFIIYLNDSLLYLYFFYLITSIIEIIIYKFFISIKLASQKVYNIRRGLKILYKNRNYAINLAISSFIWLFASNIDKIYFVNISNLDIYGAYVIVVNFSIIPLFLFAPVYEASFPHLNNIYHKNQLESFYFLFKLLISFSLITLFIFLIISEIFSEVFWSYLFNDIYKQKIANSIFFNFLLGYFLLSFSYIIYTFLKIKGKMKSHTILSAIWGVGILFSFYISMVKNSDAVLYSNCWLIVNFSFFVIFCIVNLYYYSNIKSILNFLFNMLPALVVFLVIYSIAFNINFIKNNLTFDLFLLILFSKILLILFIILIKDLRNFLINFAKDKLFNSI